MNMQSAKSRLWETTVPTVWVFNRCVERVKNVVERNLKLKNNFKSPEFFLKARPKYSVHRHFGDKTMSHYKEVIIIRIRIIITLTLRWGLDKGQCV